jgi:UDP-glucose 4-epimerase
MDVGPRGEGTVVHAQVRDISLVTGGAGFIGSNLVAALLQEGRRVRVFDDLSTGRPENLRDEEDLEVVEGDVRDLDAVRGVMRDVGPIFHRAAVPSVARSIADPLASHDTNATGTLNVLIAARDEGAGPVIYASTAAVYGNADRLPVVETMTTRPISAYGVSKLAGENYLRAFHASYGLPTIALRYLNVFGPRQNPRSEYASVVPRFVLAALAGEPATIFGDGEQTRDFTFVDDIVHANLLAAQAGERAWGQPFNIGAATPHTVNELLDAVQEAAGTGPVTPNRTDPRPGDVRANWADISAAREVLAFEPRRPFTEGLAITVEWFREHELEVGG